MDDVARLLAYEEIRQLAARYAVAVDQRDLDALVGLFIDDVRVGRDTYGRDALRTNFEESLAAIGPSILNIGTHQIDLIDDDHATGHVYCKGRDRRRRPVDPPSHPLRTTPTNAATATGTSSAAFTSCSTAPRWALTPWASPPPTGPSTTTASAPSPTKTPPGRPSPTASPPGGSQEGGVVHVFVGGLHGHANGDVGDIAADHVADEAGAFVEVHQGDGEGDAAAEGGGRGRRGPR